MPLLAGLAALTAYQFRLYANRTAQSSPDPTDDFVVLTSEDCQHKCYQDLLCTCAIFKQTTGRCSKLRWCDPGHLVRSPGHDVYIRTSQDEVSARGAASAVSLYGASSAPSPLAGPSRTCSRPLLPSCQFARPEILVNMSMAMHNVDLEMLDARPALRSDMVGAIKAAIAKAAGHNLTRDDVLLELSSSKHLPIGLFPSGSLVLVAVVQPLSSTPPADVGRSLRSADLSGLLTREASDVVGSTQVAWGPVTIDNVSVFLQDSQGGGLPRWVVLLVLVLLLSVGVAALAAAAGGFCLKRIHYRCMSREERELVSCQEPLDDIPGSIADPVELRFIDRDGEEQVFSFTCRPVGITFDEQEPTRVAGFPVGSCARRKGVKAGWVLSQIADVQIPRHCSLREVLRCIDQHTKDLDPWPLRMDFATSRGEIRTIYFTEGPLGISFLNSLPIVVDGFKPGSVARELGVERGWALLRIGDFDLQSETSLQTVLSYVIDGASQLPPRTDTSRSSRCVSNPDASRSREPLLKRPGLPAADHVASLYL